MLNIFGLKSGNRLQRKDTFFQYSTSEQFTGSYWMDGKKIFEKTINIGVLPNSANNGVKTVSHGIGSLNRIVGISGVASSNREVLPMPHVNPWALSDCITVRITATDITIGTNSNKSEYSGYVTLQYTKNN